MSKGLRILSGIYKRKAIKLPTTLSVRPTLVRARKMIFDILMHHLGREFSFLDAFAGSGIMGIEALSIGASKVVFFDNNPLVIKNLKSNLEKFSHASYTVIKTNSLSPPNGSPMDVIFLDPPYKQINIISDVIKKLKKYGWIDSKTLLILEIPNKNIPQFKQTFKLIKEKKVANSIFRFLYLIDDKLNTETFNSQLNEKIEEIGA